MRVEGLNDDQLFRMLVSELAGRSKLAGQHEQEFIFSLVRGLVEDNVSKAAACWEILWGYVSNPEEPWSPERADRLIGRSSFRTGVLEGRKEQWRPSANSAPVLRLNSKRRKEMKMALRHEGWVIGKKPE